MSGAAWAGLLMGYSRETSARSSFLLAVPTVVAFGVGLGVIVAFLKFISCRGHPPFVANRNALGLVVLALLGAGVLGPL